MCKTTINSTPDNRKLYPIYLFFIVHMFMFGYVTFKMAYLDTDDSYSDLYACTAIAISSYIGFYIAIFGLDSIKWLFINSILGVLGIYGEFSWAASLFGTDINDYPFFINAIPFTYYILYTFLIRRAVIDFTASRHNETRRKHVELYYIAISVIISAMFYYA